MSKENPDKLVIYERYISRSDLVEVHAKSAAIKRVRAVCVIDNIYIYIYIGFVLYASCFFFCMKLEYPFSLVLSLSLSLSLSFSLTIYHLLCVLYNNHRFSSLGRYPGSTLPRKYSMSTMRPTLAL